MECPFVRAPEVAQYTGMRQVLKIAPVGWWNIVQVRMLQVVNTV